MIMITSVIIYKIDDIACCVEFNFDWRSISHVWESDDYPKYVHQKPQIFLTWLTMTLFVG